MGWITMSILSCAVIIFIGVQSANASTQARVACKVVDMEVNELLEELSVAQGERVQVERWKMAQYIPKDLNFFVAYQSNKVSITESISVKKTQQVTHESIRNVYPQLKYSIECAHPRPHVPTLVEAQGENSRKDG